MTFTCFCRGRCWDVQRYPRDVTVTLIAGFFISNAKATYENTSYFVGSNRLWDSEFICSNVNITSLVRVIVRLGGSVMVQF